MTFAYIECNNLDIYVDNLHREVVMSMKIKLLITYLLCFILMASPTYATYSQMQNEFNNETLPRRFLGINLSDVLADPMSAIDKAQQALETDNLTDDMLLDGYLVLGYAYWWIADMETAKTWIDKFDALAQTTHSPSREMASDLLYVLYYKDIGELDTARSTAKRYEGIKNQGDPNVRYFAMMISEKMAIIQVIDGELYNAANHLLEVMDYYEAIQEYGLEINTINNLMVLYTTRKDYNKALTYAEKGLEIARNQKDIGAQILIMTNIMQCWIELDQTFDYEMEIHELKGLLDDYDSPWHQYAGYSVIALTYLKYEQYEKAKEYGKLSAEYAEQSDDMYGKYSSLVIEAAASAYMGDYDKGTSQIQEYLAILEDYVEDVDLFREILADVYQYGGDYEKALEIYKTLQKRTETFFLDERQRDIDELEIIYETNKKEQEILKLSSENEIRSIKMENQRAKQRYILIASGIMFFIMIVLIVQSLKARKVNQKLKMLNDKLSEISIKDSLTGLYNRHYLISQIDDEIAELRKKTSRDSMIIDKLVFFMIDIDFFKNVNDKYGHFAGDEVLKEFASRLIHLFNTSDLVVRWGGEEFLVMAKDITQEEAHIFANKIRTCIKQTPFITQDQTINITCSIGYCTYPFFKNDTNSLSWEHAVQLADKALYKAKKDGRDTVVGISNSDDANEKQAEKVIIEDREKAIELGILKYISLAN